MEDLTRIYLAIVGDEIAYLFSVAILAWLGLAIVLLFIPALRKRDFRNRLIGITPNSLATLGVLGTFTGILIGLLDFNVDDIDESVRRLSRLAWLGRRKASNKGRDLERV